ncbi:MAG: hypothetical protein H0T69_19830, partial [Thermoleophilaceae bacterium]|nr:hypothetical protein [Thermoleophilaceae bacterium]
MSQWLGGRRLVLAAGFAAALPFIVSAAHAIAVDWTPYGDDAVIAARSLDVFTGNSPLVGQWTSGLSEVLALDVYTPGPPLYWLLALPARFLAPEWMAATMGLVNAACAIGAVALAHRRGGRPLMFATAIAIPVMLASLPAESYSDVWNPSVPLPPLMLLVFLAWSLGCCEYRLLPLTVLVASFVAETHLSYVAPTLAATAVGLVGLVVCLRSRGRDERGPVWRWVVAAVLVGVVLWAPPLIDEATNSPGNLALLRIAATTGEPKLGIEAGGRAVVHTVGILPWWLQGPNGPLEGIADVTTRPGGLSIGSALLVLLALVAVIVPAVRRRRVGVIVGAVLALALCAAVAFDAASTPSNAVDTVHYTLRWASVAGMYAWLVLAWSLARLFV